MPKRKLIYVPEKQDAFTRVLRWNLCQKIIAKIFHSDLATSELERVADEPPTAKQLGFVTRRIGKN
jgi:hypothetical protein